MKNVPKSIIFSIMLLVVLFVSGGCGVEIIDDVHKWHPFFPNDRNYATPFIGTKAFFEDGTFESVKVDTPEEAPFIVRKTSKDEKIHISLLINGDSHEKNIAYATAINNELLRSLADWLAKGEKNPRFSVPKFKDESGIRYGCHRSLKKNGTIIATGICVEGILVEVPSPSRRFNQTDITINGKSYYGHLRVNVGPNYHDKRFDSLP